MQGSIEAPAAQSMNLQSQLESTANNLANSQTVGYKRRMTVFAQTLARSLAGANDAGVGPGGRVVESAPGGPARPRSIRPDQYRQQAAGVSLEVDFSQGPLRRTGEPTHLAIQGDGFFVVESPDGLAYTRDGQFALNRLGQLVDASGRLVAGTEGPIVIPPDVARESISVSPEGVVQAGDRQYGRIRVVDFADLSVLRPAGESRFLAPEGVEPTAPNQTTIRSGHLELSNVQTMPEMVNLIEVSRMYEANMKSIRSQDERVKSLLQVALG